MVTDIIKARGQKVVKDNMLIQDIVKKTYAMGTQEQKIIIYIISLIKPEDAKKEGPHIYSIDIPTFCEICGIEGNNSGNIAYIQNTLRKISNYRFYVKYTDKDKNKKQRNHDMEFQWIVTPDIIDSKTIEVEIPSKVFKHLVGLTKRFTVYELWQILPLKNKYSIALYELFKSYEYEGTIEITLEDLKRYLCVEDKYSTFKNFKNRILSPAKEEINNLTDLVIEWEGVRTLKTYTSIIFYIRKGTAKERLNSYANSKTALDG